MRKISVLLLVAAVAACSDDDESTTSSSAPDSVSSAAPSTEPATTPEPTTTPSTDPPTTTPQTPTTSAEDALKAQIAADYERTYFARYEMLGSPSLETLEARVGELLVPGSPAFTSFVARIQELVSLGDVVVPNDPDILDVTVENVELVGGAPYSESLVTVCEVENRKQVTPPENSPNGQQIEVFGTGDLIAIRAVQTVRATPAGWLLFESPSEAEGIFVGEDTCPPA